MAIRKAVINNNQDVFYERGTKCLAPGFEFESKGLRVTLDQLLAETTDAAKQRLDQAKPPRGRLADTALASFVAVLRQFWVEKLGRSFYDAFVEDFESSEDPDRGTCTPGNDASRFVVGAVQRLIGEHVDAGTCRWMMRRVSEGT